jgi:ABC-type nitrate/sulfonate/bicarbonate transport system permease component
MTKYLSYLSLILFFVLWHLFSVFKVIDPQFFPSPFLIMNRLILLLKTNEFRLDITSSLLRLFFGTIISVPLAYFTATITSHSIFFDRIINPLIALTYPLPKVAIMPLLMIIFGIGDTFKIVIISLGMFYLLFINLHSSMIRIKNSRQGEIVKIFNVQGLNYFFHVLFKGSFLDFLLGFKASLGYGLTLVVVSEFSMSKNGIGNFIWKGWDQFRILDMYAAIALLSIIGFFFYMFLDTVIKNKSKYY